MQKVEKAINTKGPCYVQVHVPCCTGWGFEGDQTIAIAKLAIDRALGELRDGRRQGHQGKEGHEKTGGGIPQDPEEVPPPLQAKAAGRRDRRYPGNR